MWTTEFPLDLHMICVGNHQVDGDQHDHGWVFNKCQGKLGDHNRKHGHKRAKSHIPQKEYMDWYRRIHGRNLSG